MAQYYGYNDNRRGTFLDFIPVGTRNILIINVIVFIATSLRPEFMVDAFALHFPGIPRYYSNPPLFRWWQPLTYMFMHGGSLHILFNMYTLVIFGIVLERTLETRKFLILYFAAGFSAAALHLGVEFFQTRNLIAANNLMAYDRVILTPMLGASGAVYGVLVALAMLYPDSVLTPIFPPIPMKAKWWVLIFAAAELSLGLLGTNEGIAHFAHLGGMIGGALLVLYWKKTRRIY